MHTVLFVHKPTWACMPSEDPEQRTASGVEDNPCVSQQETETARGIVDRSAQDLAAPSIQLFKGFPRTHPRSSDMDSYSFYGFTLIYIALYELVPQTDLSVGVLTVLYKGPCLVCGSRAKTAEHFSL
jgi:hypothetical protein